MSCCQRPRTALDCPASCGGYSRLMLRSAGDRLRGGASLAGHSPVACRPYPTGAVGGGQRREKSLCDSNRPQVFGPCDKFRFFLRNLSVRVGQAGLARAPNEPPPPGAK